MLLDEVRAFPDCLVSRVGTGDDLESHQSIRIEQPVTVPEERIEVLVPDGFEHLDGDDPVEASFHAAIILEPDADQFLESFFLNLLPRVRVLLLRDRDRRDAAAVRFRKMNADGTPTASDLETLLPAFECEKGADPFDLRLLRGFDRHVRAFEDRRGIDHRLVEEQAEEIVREVVVSSNVPAASGDRVPSQTMYHPVDRRKWTEEQFAPAGRRKRGRVLRVQNEPGDHLGEVISLPFAGHVRLGESDVAGEEAAPEELPVAHADPGAQSELRTAGVRTSPETSYRPVGKTYCEPPVHHRCEASQDERLVQARLAGDVSVQ